ncbi:MAG: glutamate-5-semialdehyde dehydrogenase [Tissierellia bacterium]|nr:glutamate-5-semialdehyde dehydrogenase [Tissierellia bacterium]
MIELGKRAKEAAKSLAKLSTVEKNELLLKIGKEIDKERNYILEQNKKDMAEGEKNNLTPGLLDRLLLTNDRIDDLITGAKEVAGLEDPVGEMEGMKRLPNGLNVGQRRVPLGVVAIIYEARPNVTVDCSLLCIKSSNALILRGGKEAIYTNIALANIIRQGIEKAGYDKNIVQLIEDTSRDKANALMQLSDYVDVLIPRGSKSLIDAVKREAKVPVLETGVGNCHVYVDDSAELDMALNIVENAKTQRVGVCNAMETLLVHEKVAKEFLPMFDRIRKEHNIIVHGCERSKEILPDLEDATEEDYYTEYLAMECALKIVDSCDEAIDHITKYGTGHSDVIVTHDYFNSKKFLERVDSACVYVNASSRFTDGAQLGKGAEMGISTQKLHARGPVGVKELTSTKLVILGDGQVRD